MAKKDKPCIAYLNMGPWPVYVGFTTSEDDFQREMKRLGVEGSIDFLGHGRAHATTHTLENAGSLCIVIAMEAPTRKRSREQYAALLAHEAVHVVQGLRDELSRSEPLGHEAEAYLVQQIVQECLQMAWDTPRKRRTAPVG